MSATLLGEPVALCAIVRLALRTPGAVGVKDSLIAHEAPAATLPPATQVVPPAIWNSAACAPPIVRALRASDAVPLLLTVTVCADDGTFTVCVKFNVIGETPITGVSATPVHDARCWNCRPRCA